MGDGFGWVLIVGLIPHLLAVALHGICLGQIWGWHEQQLGSMCVLPPVCTLPDGRMHERE